MATATMEDYLECISILMEDKGYARVSDIASFLNVHPSTVTRMVKRLDKHGYIQYKRYRGLTLTDAGKQLGKAIRQKHRMLETLLRLLGVQQEDVIYQDVEGIEHHLSTSTLKALFNLVDFLEKNPRVLNEYKQFCSQKIRPTL